MLLNLVLLFVAGVVAFTIPDGQPNGIYEVSYDASGVETHTLISHNVTSRGLVNSAKFPKRSFSSGTATCAGEPLLNAGDTDAANGLMDGYCGEGRTITPYYDAYAIYDCTVSYFCNFYNGPAYCTASQRQEATANVAQVCGPYVPGWWTFVDVDAYASYGNEYYCTLPGQDFCGHSH